MFLKNSIHEIINSRYRIQIKRKKRKELMSLGIEKQEAFYIVRSLEKANKLGFKL